MLGTYEALKIIRWIEAHQDIGCTVAGLLLSGENDAYWVEDTALLRNFAAECPEMIVEGFCQSCRYIWPLDSDRPRRIQRVILRP